MRRTVHLVSAADCLALRSLHQPMLDGRMQAVLRRRLEGVDLLALAAAARPLLHREPQRLPDVARAVGGRWPQAAVRDLADALGVLLPLVQTPPRGMWGHRSAPALNTTVEAWLGRPVDPEPADAGALVLRYLAAYGPATSADVRAWSGLTGLPAVLARLAPQLEVLRDEHGRRLLDVPGLPRPDPDTPAPVRFLPAFDNLVLGFQHRERVVDTGFRHLSVGGARFVLVDGRVAGTWSTGPATDGGVRVHVSPLRRLSAPETSEVAAEGYRLASFLGDGAGGDVVVAAPGA